MFIVLLIAIDINVEPIYSTDLRQNNSINM